MTDSGFAMNGRKWRQSPAALRRGHALRAIALAALFGVGGMGGCGKEKIETHAVSGSVAFQGKAPSGAVVTFHPKGTWPHPALPVGTVADDGSFRVGTFDISDGAPSGEYAVTVQWFPVAADGSVGRNAIPERYASRDTTPLAATVAAGGASLPVFKIDRK